jgi:hypothetical protein
MMEQTRKIDRTQWGVGPWDDEKDRYEWESEGLACLALRAEMGNWCGYVAVPPGHPWHGVGYGDCAAGCAEIPTRPLRSIGGIKVPDFMQARHMESKSFACRENYEYRHTPGDIIEVHGGLTYSDKCQGDICHVPKPGESDDVWWFGFDCAHSSDIIPAMTKFVKEGHLEWGTYKTLAYAIQETEDLAKQLAEVSKRQTGELGEMTQSPY